MDRITRTPGLIQIAEQIFSNLAINDLFQCQKVNEYWASILRNPWFWYKRMTQKNILTKIQQKEWSNFCDKLNKLDLTKEMTKGLNFIYERLERSVPFNEVYASAPWSALDLASAELVEIMAPLFDNPNAPDENGRTPIYWAALYGHTEIVKILAPLTDNPNAPYKNGNTPIHKAASCGYAEIIKILAPLTDNPNAPDKEGRTPFDIAKNEEIRTILESFNPSKRRIKDESPYPQSTKRSREN